MSAKNGKTKKQSNSYDKLLQDIRVLIIEARKDMVQMGKFRTGNAVLEKRSANSARYLKRKAG